jgi:hypothetical protein
VKNCVRSRSLFAKILIGLAAVTAAELSPRPALGQQQTNLPRVTSVCEVVKRLKEFEGHEISVRGHFFQGHHGAAVSATDCGAPLTMLTVWGNFDRPKTSDNTHSFIFHGRVEQKSGLGLDGQQTRLVLVVDRVSPAN